MSKTIDVTGLSPDAVRVLESLVKLLREKPTPSTAISIFDLFGKAPILRTGEDIAKQVQDEGGP